MYLTALLVGAFLSAASTQNSCTPNYCNNGGVCVDVLGSPSCACPAGFTGNRCQNGAAPVSGPCSTSPCQNGGQCVPSGDIFTCNCQSGFSGFLCQNNGGGGVTNPPATSVPSTGVCAQNPCRNGATCNANGDLFTCSCPPGFSGFICQVTGGPGATVAPQSASCPSKISDKDNIACSPAEIVFMIEYARGDSYFDVDHEGDFIKRVIDLWTVDDQNIRIGVVTYHDTVSEVIHIDDYPNDPQGLKDRITAIARRLRPSGQNDLATALDYVRNTSFTNSRADAEKIVIPFVHMMPEATKPEIVAAAQRLKDDCITIIGLGVTNSRASQFPGTGGTTTTDAIVDANIMNQLVTAPSASHYEQYRDYTDLENSARDFDDTCIHSK